MATTLDRRDASGTWWRRGAALAVVFLLAAPAAAFPPSGFDVVVGRVGGEKVMASAVLDREEAQLTELGRALPEDEFRAQAEPLLADRIHQVVIEQLMLQEAERELGAELEPARTKFLQEHRARLVEEWGDGDAAAADRRLERNTDQGLDATVRFQWERALLQRRIDALFRGRLDVTDEEVRRVYERRREVYHRPARRGLRMITAVDEAAADRIDAALARGALFEDVCVSPDNVRSRVSGDPAALRWIADGDLAGSLRVGALGLAPGEHSERLAMGARFHWIELVEIQPPVVTTLDEARPEIEGWIRSRRQRDIQTEHIAVLLRAGEYTPLEKMVEGALRAAVQRYVRRT